MGRPTCVEDGPARDQEDPERERRRGRVHRRGEQLVTPSPDVTKPSATAGEGATTGTVECFAEGADGTRIYVRRRQGGDRESGRAVTAVMADGIICDGYIYKYLAGDLAPLVNVAHWNYRGHGRSGVPVDPGRIKVEDHAADLDAVRHCTGDPPVVLLGHSFGTQVVLEAYRLRPE